MPKQSPQSWYYSGLIKEVAVITGMITFFPTIILFYLNSKWGVDAMTALTYGIVIWSLGMIINIASYIYRRTRYTRWVRGEHYKLVGLNEFFATRTPTFWTKRTYTYVKIIFNLAPITSEANRQALKEFIDHEVASLNKWYGETDWEPGKGIPKDFKANKNNIICEISQGGLRRIITILSSKFIPLSKSLGSNLLDVTIHSNTKESQYSVTDEKTGVYEREEFYRTLRSLDD